MRFSLNGDDWKVTGYWKNQWRTAHPMEMEKLIIPAVATIPAQVPGAVQADLMKAGLLADPNYSLDSNLGEWVNNREWFYDKEFILSPGIHGEKYILCFEGLDYHGEIYLNETRITEFSGMFIPVEIDVTGIINREGKNHLRVIFYQTPEVDGQFGYSNQIRLIKSRFNYIWDWCPRIVPVGIWEDVYIKIYNYARITDFFPRTIAEYTDNTGKIIVDLEINTVISGEYEIIYRILHESKEILFRKDKVRLLAARQIVQCEITLDNVEIWWPSGHGGQPLYQIEVMLFKEDGVICDKVNKRVGFSSRRFVHNESEPAGAIPYTLIMNGKRIFLRGVNWVPISPFYGCVTKDQYRNYLCRFKDMNCNILRVWGGAILEKEEFYDLCDEMGLMVWQEFPQSSSGVNNTPPDDPCFLKDLEKAASIYIRKKRHHASHIIWCGGNELMWENYSPVDERHINIKMLKELVNKLDPEKYFLPTSASGPRFGADSEEFGKGVNHDVHGPWGYLGEPEHYRFFNGDDSLFRSETGCPGISRMELLDKYRGTCSIWPPDKTNPYWVHRGGGWIQWKELTILFGEWKNNGEDIRQYIKASRLLQAEALRYAIEATRRREPLSSGFIIWMGNEPFPNNANTSIIEYDGTPKPSYYWIMNAFSSLHISAKYSKIGYSSNEIFAAEIYITDEIGTQKDIEVEAQILDIRGKVIYQFSKGIKQDGQVMKAGTVEWEVMPCEYGIFFLRLKLLNATGILDENTYLFTIDSTYPYQPLRNLPNSTVRVCKSKTEDREWIVTNSSLVSSIGIFLYGKIPTDFLKIYPNYFTLMPGEQRKVYIYSTTNPRNNDTLFSIDTLN